MHTGVCDDAALTRPHSHTYPHITHTLTHSSSHPHIRTHSHMLAHARTHAVALTCCRTPVGRSTARGAWTRRPP
eukprot:480654-Rhodomonas_salina.1